MYPPQLPRRVSYWQWQQTRHDGIIKFPIYGDTSKANRVKELFVVSKRTARFVTDKLENCHLSSRRNAITKEHGFGGSLRLSSCSSQQIVEKPRQTEQQIGDRQAQARTGSHRASGNLATRESSDPANEDLAWYPPESEHVATADDTAGIGKMNGNPPATYPHSPTPKQETEIHAPARRECGISDRPNRQTAKDSGGKSRGNGGCGGPAIGAGARSRARFGEITHLGRRIRVDEAGDPAAAAARCPEPQVRNARRGGASLVGSPWLFLVEGAFSIQSLALLLIRLPRGVVDIDMVTGGNCDW